VLSLRGMRVTVWSRETGTRASGCCTARVSRTRARRQSAPTVLEPRALRRGRSCPVATAKLGVLCYWSVDSPIEFPGSVCNGQSSVAGVVNSARRHFEMALGDLRTVRASHRVAHHPKAWTRYGTRLPDHARPKVVTCRVARL